MRRACCCCCSAAHLLLFAVAPRRVAVAATSQFARLVDSQGTIRREGRPESTAPGRAEASNILYPISDIQYPILYHIEYDYANIQYPISDASIDVRQIFTYPEPSKFAALREACGLKAKKSRGHLPQGRPSLLIVPYSLYAVLYISFTEYLGSTSTVPRVSTSKIP